MTNIKLDSRVMSNLKNENLIAMLNEVIDSELDKDVSQVDTKLVEDCIDAVLLLQQEEDDSFKALVPLMSSDQFLKKIMPNNSWKRLNVFARAAVVAAVVATGTFSVNAAVKAVTGYDFLNDISSRITAVMSSNSGLDKDDQVDYFETTTANNEIIPVENTTEEATEATTVVEEATTKAVEETTKEPTSNVEPIITEATTKEVPTRRVIERTTIPVEQVVTTVPMASPKPDKNNPPEKELTNIYVNSINMKTNYIYGESLSYDGLELACMYSDGSLEPLSYADCMRTSNFDTSKVGDYIVKLVYQNAIVEISVSVRPNEETRFSDMCTNGIYDYLLTKEGAYLTKYYGDEENIVLDTVDGDKLYAVGPRLFEDSNIKSFKSNSCQIIKENAFNNCSKLAKVDIPNCSYIGKNAFSKTDIEDITIPARVTAIEEGTFDGCESLTTVNMLGKVDTIKRFAFNECPLLEEITGAENIKRVEDFAFYDDQELTLDSTLDNLKYAGDYAFGYCRKVDFDTIENMEHIGDGAFQYCSNINSVSIPGNITTVPKSAFRGARITSLVLSEGVEAVDDYVFMSTYITSLTLPESLKEIGTYAFYTNRLTSVKFLGDADKIGPTAFYPSKKLAIYCENYNDSFANIRAYARSNNITCFVNGSIDTGDEEL